LINRRRETGGQKKNNRFQSSGTGKKEKEGVQKGKRIGTRGQFTFPAYRKGLNWGGGQDHLPREKYGGAGGGDPKTVRNHDK